MRTVDLFAGCGGLSLGFTNAEFDILAAFEYWDDAIECYRANFDHPVFKRDLSDFVPASNEIALLNPEIIIGGPPCQDFSNAGKRLEGDRAVLTSAFANIVSSVTPRWFVMENVDRAANSQAYAQARQIFVEAGYGLTERVLDASLCGVPQKRKRFFCIGLLGAEDGFLNEIIDANLAERRMTLRDYFGDSLGIDHYYRHPRNYNRRGIFSIDEPAPTVRGVNRPVPAGYLGHPTDPIAVAPDLRPLTTLERSMVQTFPRDFVWTGSRTSLEQIIGNAVPVNLAQFVGHSIQQYAHANIVLV